MQIPQLTFTRFLASIAIVVLHYGLFTFPFNTEVVAPLANKGVGAVSFFFVLSGFILVVSSAKDGILPKGVEIWKFYRKRIIRIVPVYLLAILIFFLLNFEYNPESPLIWQIHTYVYSIFFLQSWHYEMAMDINYPAWSLSVEAFFYAIFPFLFWLFQKFKLPLLLFFLVASSLFTILPYALLIDTDTPEAFIKYFPPFHLGTFIIGLISGILFIRYKEWFFGKGKKIIQLSTALLTAVFTLFVFTQFTFFKYQHNGMFAPYFILILITLAISKGKIIDLISSKAFIFLGTISYSIYIFQFPILQFCQKYVPYLKGKSESDIFYSYALILIFFSCITYLFFEKPISQFFKKK